MAEPPSGGAAQAAEAVNAFCPHALFILACISPIMRSRSCSPAWRTSKAGPGARPCRRTSAHAACKRESEAGIRAAARAPQLTLAADRKLPPQTIPPWAAAAAWRCTRPSARSRASWRTVHGCACPVESSERQGVQLQGQVEKEGQQAHRSRRPSNERARHSRCCLRPWLSHSPQTAPRPCRCRAPR